ncbi:MAG: LytTR family DNA-binding domain-containing protein [Flavobacteriales bacterium]|nr:LytTR family DNA-binding domain-containing protein [Flavobacteriales bacterium]
MIKCILIDDEPKAIASLERMLTANFKDLMIAAKAHSIHEAAESIQRHQPHLIFLDMELQCESGFDLFKEFPNPSFKTIVVSAYSQYAIKAMRFEALDYLLKPLMLDDLIAAINRYKKNQTDIPVSNVSQMPHSPSRLAVPTGYGKIYLLQKEILRLKADGAYTNIYAMNEKPIKASYNLSHFEPMLDQQLFMRCHKSQIVNLSMIKQVIRNGHYHAELIDHSLVEISRTYRHAFEERLNHSLR